MVGPPSPNSAVATTFGRPGRTSLTPAGSPARPRYWPSHSTTAASPPGGFTLEIRISAWARRSVSSMSTWSRTEERCTPGRAIDPLLDEVLPRKVRQRLGAALRHEDRLAVADQGDTL